MGGRDIGYVDGDPRTTNTDSQTGSIGIEQVMRRLGIVSAVYEPAGLYGDRGGGIVGVVETVSVPNSHVTTVVVIAPLIVPKEGLGHKDLSKYAVGVEAKAFAVYDTHSSDSEVGDVVKSQGASDQRISLVNKHQSTAVDGEPPNGYRGRAYKVEAGLMRALALYAGSWFWLLVRVEQGGTFLTSQGEV